MSNPLKSVSKTKEIISSYKRSQNNQFQSIELSQKFLADQDYYSIHYNPKKMSKSQLKSQILINAIHQKDALQVNTPSKYLEKDLLQEDVNQVYIQNQDIIIQDQQTNTHIIGKLGKSLKSKKNFVYQSPYIKQKGNSTKKKSLIEDLLPISNQSQPAQKEFYDPFLSTNHISDQYINQYKKEQAELYKRVIAREQIICFNCGGPHYKSNCPVKNQNDMQNTINSKCFNCKQLGHTAKYCQIPKKCMYCKQIGHFGRDCKSNEAEQKKRVCLNCDQIGHYARQCKKPKKCNRCFQFGHIMSNCPKNAYNKRQAASCYNCKKMGHYVKECPQKPSCHTCGQLNHFSSECPNNPRKKSLEASKISKISQANSKINKSKSQVNFSGRKVLKLSQTNKNSHKILKKSEKKGFNKNCVNKFLPTIGYDTNEKFDNSGNKNSQR